MQDTWSERLSSEEEAAASEVATALGPASNHMQEEPAPKIVDGASPIPWPLPTTNQNSGSATGCAEPAR